MMPPDRIPLYGSPLEGPYRDRPYAHRWARTAPALEREVERLEARVAQLESEKVHVESFAAVAAHELVEPLVMAQAFAAIVSERLAGEEHADSRRDLDALSRGMARIRLLAESLLHDARAVDRTLEFRPVDVSALVSDSLALLAPDIQARGARVEVGELPAVLGEESLLMGVISNLLINALKYSPRHGAAIRVHGVRDGVFCRFHVDSEGPTIPSADRHRIFDAFERGPGERRAIGTGLGLAICRRIVTRHGGDIGVTPAPGGGNRFSFSLPAP